MGSAPPPGVANRGPVPPRRVVLPAVLVLAALFLGVAAALLSGAPPNPVSLPAQSGTFITYGELEVVGFVIVGAFAAWFVYRLVQRLRDPSGADLLRLPTLVFVVILVLMAAFVAIARLEPGHPVREGSSGPGTNGTMPPSPPSGNGLPSNVSFGSTSIPGWAVYVGVIAIVAIVALLVVPLTLALRSKSRPSAARPIADASARARAEIAATLARLEADPDADPRALILALYARLLGALEPRVGDLGPRTARELERAAVVDLGLPPSEARELTGLFEEARYSAHALGAADSQRARTALGRILAALGSGAPPT